MQAFENVEAKGYGFNLKLSILLYKLGEVGADLKLFI